MARAKRTARADARRRYRAEHHQSDESTDSDDDVIEADSAVSAPGASATDRGPGGGGRIGIGTAFRLAFRPLDVRSDLAALPSIAIRSKALWVPLVLVIGSTAVLAATGGKDIVSQFMFAYFIQTPAIGGVFLAGFLAPRASWLLGVIIGLVSAICYGIIIAAFPSAVAAVTPSQAQVAEAFSAAVVLSPVMGAFFAAGAAWYRRFLQYTSPNRSRRQPAKSSRRDGKRRSAGSQGANARR